MQFSIVFLKNLITGVGHASPILGMLCSAIFAIGLWVGKRERWSRFDSIYWALITAATVGYGDMRPTRRPTKIASIVIAFIGLIFTGIVIAIAVESARRALLNSI